MVLYARRMLRVYADVSSSKNILEPWWARALAGRSLSPSLAGDRDCPAKARFHARFARALYCSPFWIALPVSIGVASGQTSDRIPLMDLIKGQGFSRPEECLPCHRRQYDELRTAVKAGYRNVSPLFNALELAGNFLGGGRLRPVYGDSAQLTTDGTPLTANMVSAQRFTHVNEMQAGFCIGCHAPHVLLMGEDPDHREIPELAGVGMAFRPAQIRPLRDYHFIDGRGEQVLPAAIGGSPPPGSAPSLGASGISCDVCHNVVGPDRDRSVRRDGLGNGSFTLFPSLSKVGPFKFPLAVKDTFHSASLDPNRIAYLRSSDYCGSCHDVRMPGISLTHWESNLNEGSESVTTYRLENLNTEWQTGAYNSTDNPFGRVIRCQDCHMSAYPYGGDSTYQVGNMRITSPTPAVFTLGFAAEPGISTEFNAQLPKRPITNHYFTGVDVPLMSAAEMSARLGPGYPEADVHGLDQHGVPNGLAQRREDLLEAAVRISLDETDQQARAGQPFTVRLTAVSLTGHRFPAGFSQERTAYVELTIKDLNGFLLYQSGYVVDKPHPETGEMEPDGNLDDEDLEHVHAVVDPGRWTAPYRPGTASNGHTNSLFALGPDNGPEARVFFGADHGLVLWRNALTRVFLPGDAVGRANANNQPVVAQGPHFEETFSAAFANSVDNYRSLAPLRPTTYRYNVKLPTEEELGLLGIDLIGPLHIQAQVNFLHFPPLFLRFLARTTGADGPAGHDLNLFDEQRMDDFLVNVRGVARAETFVELVP